MWDELVISSYYEIPYVFTEKCSRLLCDITSAVLPFFICSIDCSLTNLQRKTFNCVKEGKFYFKRFSIKIADSFVQKISPR